MIRASYERYMNAIIMITYCNRSFEAIFSTPSPALRHYPHLHTTSELLETLVARPYR
jgi:hypothetical protein